MFHDMMVFSRCYQGLECSLNYLTKSWVNMHRIEQRSSALFGCVHEVDDLLDQN